MVVLAGGERPPPLLIIFWKNAGEHVLWGREEEVGRFILEVRRRAERRQVRRRQVRRRRRDVDDRGMIIV